MIDLAKARSAYIAEYMRVRRLGHGTTFARLAAMSAARPFLLA